MPGSLSMDTATLEFVVHSQNFQLFQALLDLFHSIWQVRWRRLCEEQMGDRRRC